MDPEPGHGIPGLRLRCAEPEIMRDDLLQPEAVMLPDGIEIVRWKKALLFKAVGIHVNEWIVPDVFHLTVHLVFHKLESTAVAELHSLRKGTEKDLGKAVHDFPPERVGALALHDDHGILLPVCSQLNAVIPVIAEILCSHKSAGVSVAADTDGN